MRYVKPFLLASTVLSLFLAQCTPHVVMQAKSVGIPAGSTIGVLIDLPWGQSTNNDLAAFMVAALMRKEYKVKSINPEDLIPKGVWGRISNDPDQDKRYAFIASVATMVENGGKLKGDKDMWNRLMQVNEIKEASMRFSDLNSLVDDFIKRWDTEYIMFVTPSMNTKLFQINPHEYLIRILRIKDRETVFVYYIKSNDADFQAKIPNPSANNVDVNLSAKSSNEYKMIKFCSYVAGLIQ